MACIHELMKHGFDVEAAGSIWKSRPLHLAARFNHIYCVKTLIEDYGASANARDINDHTPYLVAILSENFDTAKLLKSKFQCVTYGRIKEGRVKIDAAKNTLDQAPVSFMSSLRANQRMLTGDDVISPEPGACLCAVM